MNVLIVNDFPPGLSGCGGAETHIRQLKEALAEKGIAAAILAAQRPGLPEQIEDDLFVIPNLNAPPLRKKVRANRRGQQAALRRAQELIDRFNPDVINVHNFINPGVLRLLRRCAPVVKSMHDVRPFCVKPPPVTACRLVGDTETFCDRVFGPACFFCCYAFAGDSLTDRMAAWAQFPANMKSLKELQQYDRIVTFGTFQRELAARKFPDPGRIHIVHHFTEAERESDRCEVQAHEDPVFVFAGRFSFEKGPLHIFQALEKIPQVTCRVILAGDGPQRNEVEAMARAASPRHTIELPGFVKQKQLYALYRRSTVLLFPSIGSEGCPLVGLEAMYFGNTAIGYDTGGAGEWLVDGQTGIRVERGDIDGLAQAMARLAADPQERFRLRRQAREYVRAKFRCEQHIRDVIHLYHQAIQDRQALV